MEELEIYYRATMHRIGIAANYRIYYDEFKVVKRTKQGAHIEPNYGKTIDTTVYRRWVGDNHRKRYAYPSKEQALLALRHRSRSFLQISQNNVSEATERVNFLSTYDPADEPVPLNSVGSLEDFGF